MRTFSFIITFLLILAWGYTSWYWYTCNIKGFCDGKSSVTLQIPQEDASSIDDIPVYSGSETNTQKLSANDVLLDSQNTTTQSGGDETNTQSGILDTLSGTGREDNLVKVSQDDTGENLTLCTGNFVGPVALGGQNDPEQVKLLEKFLLSQGTSIAVDGVYENDDVDAVKAFQLEHKKDILDPWGIASPTGYVFTTTIKKMKEIACQ